MIQHKMTNLNTKQAVNDYIDKCVYLYITKYTTIGNESIDTIMEKLGDILFSVQWEKSMGHKHDLSSSDEEISEDTESSMSDSSFIDDSNITYITEQAKLHKK